MDIIFKIFVYTYGLKLLLHYVLLLIQEGMPIVPNLRSDMSMFFGFYKKKETGYYNVTKKTCNFLFLLSLLSLITAIIFSIATKISA